MDLKKQFYFASMLAILGTLCLAQTCNAQSIPTLPGSGVSGQKQASAAGTQPPIAQTSAAISVSGSHEYGPFGIGKPRNFPVLRYLHEQHLENKAKLRASPLGKIIRGLIQPLSKLTGGIVPAEPVPNEVELAAPGPQGSAAKIKKDQLEAPHRLAAIQQLGTVDCHWYPEALTQLVVALRTDRSECVRYEAAKILTQCNCCTPQMIHALKTCVSGTDSDGNPSERSGRIRDQAAFALEYCLACSDQTGANSALPMRPEYPTSPSITPPGTAPGYETANHNNPHGADGSIRRVGFDELVTSNAIGTPNPDSRTKRSPDEERSDARKLLERFRNAQNAQQQPSPNNLMDAWRKSK